MSLNPSWKQTSHTPMQQFYSTTLWVRLWLCVRLVQVSSSPVSLQLLSILQTLLVLGPDRSNIWLALEAVTNRAALLAQDCECWHNTMHGGRRSSSACIMECFWKYIYIFFWNARRQPTRGQLSDLLLPNTLTNNANTLCVLKKKGGKWPSDCAERSNKACNWS